MSKSRLLFYAFSGALVVIGFYVSATGRLILNGSYSLPHNAYFMVTWPRFLIDGIYVAIAMPEILTPRLGELLLVKQIRGLPGDLLELQDNAVCVRNFCGQLEVNGGAPILVPTPSQVIPKGKFAAFGTAMSSLDSRYQDIGLFKDSDVVAVGFPVWFPHWTEVRSWLDR